MTASFHPNRLQVTRRAALMLGASAAATIGGARAGLAGTRPVVVELFTSQGCSSCPAADAFLGELSRRSNVIAVSYNVDYWDYLGWNDTLASPLFSKRQRDYAERRGDGQVYTPQMVIQGRHHVPGSRKAKVNDAITEEVAANGGEGVPVEIVERGAEVVIAAGGAPTDRMRQDATVWLLMVKPEQAVEIERGENKGRLVTYFNVVRRLVPAGMWHGEPVTLSIARADLATEPGEICAAFVQVGGVGPIIGASWDRERSSSL